jgi:hypothetical protein
VTEVLIREQIELERKRDDHARLDRINGVERALAVLQTKFEAALERAVSGDDLKELKREVEDQMKQTFDSITHSIKAANDQQVRDIMHQVGTMMANERAGAAEDQRHMRRQIFLAVFGSGLSIIAALIVFRLTS